MICSCEHGNERLSKKGKEFIDQPSYY